jgi:phosphate transport system substrate-binding protein
MATLLGMAHAQGRSDFAPAGSGSVTTPDTVRITGVRFAYPLIRHWMEAYTAIHPEVYMVIEPRTTVDPSDFDILVEAYEHDESVRRGREYLYVARYAVLPVANSRSPLTEAFASRGLTRNDITQIYFHNLFGDNTDVRKIPQPYTVYTRLQKAGAPLVFTRHYGFRQEDVRGKAVSGSDEHLRQALLRDTCSAGYLPLPLVYDEQDGLPVAGLTVLPVDLNGNGRITDDEKFYGDLQAVTQRLEAMDLKTIRNLPVGTVHLSVDRETAPRAAVDFLHWIMRNGMADLHRFGYLQLEPTPKESVSSTRTVPEIPRSPNP